MKTKYIQFLFIALLLSLSAYSQTWNFNDRISLFNDAKSDKTIVFVNDSLFYKNGKRFQLKMTPFPGRLNEYLALNIAEKTYLVHSGCGPVLEFRNDSIVRVDNSYLHNNQFGTTQFFSINRFIFLAGMVFLVTKTSSLDMTLKMANGTKNKPMVKNFQKQDVAKYLVIEKTINYIYLVESLMTQKILGKLVMLRRFFGN
jgi:hypothetical protein